MNTTSSSELVAVRVHLNEYLAELQTLEYKKPLNQQRSVPTIADLVRLTGITKATLYHFAANRYDSVRLDILATLINTLRNEGFSVTICDLLKEHPVSTIL